MIKVDYGIRCSNKKIRNNINEDYLYVNEEKCIYIVADGISRLNKDIIEYQKGKSNALYAAKMFCMQIGNELTTKPKLSKFENVKFLKKAFLNANYKFKTFLNDISEEYQEVPGCVGLASFIENDRFYYGGVGDCVGVLIRNNQKIVFFSKQTEGVVKYYHPTTSEADRKMLNEMFVNKSGTFAYGVFNGDDNVKSFFNPNFIDLVDNDVIYIMSDGVSDYILYENYDIFKALSIDDIFNNQAKMSNLRHSEYDDMTLIKIEYKK